LVPQVYIIAGKRTRTEQEQEIPNQQWEGRALATGESWVLMVAQTHIKSFYGMKTKLDTIMFNIQQGRNASNNKFLMMQMLMTSSMTLPTMLLMTMMAKTHHLYSNSSLLLWERNNTFLENLRMTNLLIFILNLATMVTMKKNKHSKTSLV
jgi:hypothetical protein